MDMRRVARALGWFSIALGAAGLLAPGRISRLLKVRDKHAGLIRSYGLREIGAGTGLLLSDRKAPWLWARAAGDVLDLGALEAARRTVLRTRAIDAAIAGVAAVTALDLAAATRLQNPAA